MKYRFVINGVRFVPNVQFSSRWQAFMWLNGILDGREPETIKIEVIK